MARKKQSEAKNNLRVAAVQMIFGQSIDENLAKIEKATGRAAEQGADVVLFPECATTGYNCDFARFREQPLRVVLQQVAATARRHAVNLLIGTPLFWEGPLRNVLALLNRSGELVYVYAKCQLHDNDRPHFWPGNHLALFQVEGFWATAIICHERRYPELVRLPVMAGAQIVFHANAGMDSPEVSQNKHKGRDGIAARAFENAIYYVFANSVGPQGNGMFSAGDSKIVAPDMTFLQLADNRREAVLVADLDMDLATRRYAVESMQSPQFLQQAWTTLAQTVRQRAIAGRVLRW